MHPFMDGHHMFSIYGTLIIVMKYQLDIISYRKINNFRFGHLNFGGLKLLHTKDKIKGFPLIEKIERICEGCIFGKKHRESFPVGKSYR